MVTSHDSILTKRNREVEIFQVLQRVVTDIADI